MADSASETLYLTLGSGLKITKGALFNVLQAGGWVTLCAIWTRLDVQMDGLWPALLDTTLIWTVCGVCLTFALRNLYRMSRRRYHSPVVFASIALSASVLGAALWWLLESTFLRLALAGLWHVDSLRPLFEKFATTVAQNSLIPPLFQWVMYAITLFTWSSLYYGVNAMLELESERAKVVSALKLADNARLRALQSNLNPHFLFNALNGIATLVREQDTNNAGAMVDALSTFLRSTLQRLETPELRVDEEIELIDQYLRIQRYRYGARLHTEMRVEPETRNALIPTLILQPLVENAVRHGVLPREEGGAVRVSVRKELSVLIVSVEDDGAGPTQGVVSAFGTGLQNSSERLAALYGCAANLTIGRRLDGSGCAVMIRLPFRRAPATEQWVKAIEPLRA